MVRFVKVKPIINKSNGQCNFSLSKKQMPKKLQEVISKTKFIKLKIEDWE